MPPPLPLTSERFERHGLFLIEDGQTIFLWVGRDAVPQLIMDVFNLPSYDVLRGGKVRFSFSFAETKLTTFLLACRQPYPSSKTPSPNVSTLSFKKHARCAVDHIIPTYTLLKKTGRLR